MPRTGSDYVWVSRIFSPSIGFAWGLLYMIVVLLDGFVGQISAFASAFSVSLTTSGIVGNSASLSNLGSTLGAPQGTFELGVVFTALFVLFAVFGTRYVKGVIYVSWVAAIVGILLMWYILSTANPTSFANNWNAMLPNNIASGLNSSATTLRFTRALCQRVRPLRHLGFRRRLLHYPWPLCFFSAAITSTDLQVKSKM